MALPVHRTACLRALVFAIERAPSLRTLVLLTLALAVLTLTLHSLR